MTKYQLHIQNAFVKKLHLKFHKGVYTDTDKDKETGEGKAKTTSTTRGGIIG